jgi:hypothetical protein
MITNDQILEAALECGFSVEPATGMIYAEDGFTKVSCKHGLTELAQHFYRQGLLDAASHLDELQLPDLYSQPCVDETVEELRQMADEVGK